MGRCAEAGEAEDIKEQFRLALEWVDSSMDGNQPRWIVPPGAEEGTRREALARATKLVEELRKQGLEVEEHPEGGNQSRWTGLRRGRGGQMSLIVRDGDEGEQGGGDERPAQEEEGREPGREADVQVEQEGEREGVGEGEGAAVDRGRESVAREGDKGWDRGGEAQGDREGDGSNRRREEEEQEPPERLQRGADDGRPKRKTARGVRYGEEGSEEPGKVREGVTVYGP